MGERFQICSVQFTLGKALLIQKVFNASNKVLLGVPNEAVLLCVCRLFPTVNHSLGNIISFCGTHLGNTWFVVYMKEIQVYATTKSFQAKNLPNTGDL